MVTNVTSVLMHARQNEQEYDVMFDKMIAMVDVIGMVLALKFQDFVEGKHSVVIFQQKPPKNILCWSYIIHT